MPHAETCPRYNHNPDNPVCTCETPHGPVEVADLLDALRFIREALFSALAGSNAAGDAEIVEDVLRTVEWMADHLNPAYSFCVSVLDGQPPGPYFQEMIDAKRAEYALMRSKP